MLYILNDKQVRHKIESYSGLSLEGSGVERGKGVLGLSFNFSNFQGFKELIFVLYDIIKKEIIVDRLENMDRFEIMEIMDRF